MCIKLFICIKNQVYDIKSNIVNIKIIVCVHGNLKNFCNFAVCVHEIQMH